MSMERPAALLALLLAVSALAAGAGAGPAAAVPDARLAVSDVTVTPGTATVGAQVVVDATLRNSAGSPSAIEVRRVELRDGDDTLVTATDVGSLSAGDTLAVPLETTFDEPGVRTLTLRVVGEADDGDRVTVTRPVPVTIEQAPPQVAVQTGPAAVDSPTRVAVTVGNPTTAPIRDVAVRLADPLGAPNRSVAFVPAFAAGTETVVNLSTVPDEVGAQMLGVVVAYTDASGVEREVSRDVAVSVAPHEPDLGVEVRQRPAPEDDGGAVAGGLSGLIGGGAAGATGGGEEPESPQTTYTVEVTNFGSVQASDVVVTPVTGNHTLPRQRLDGSLGPGESGTVAVDLGGVRSHGTVEFRVDYRAGTRAASMTYAYDYRPEVAGIELTDVAVSRSGNGSIQVSGNIVNVGRGPAQGVIVEVVREGNVTPTYPARRYFVGELDGSDFAPFDLTARATGAVDDVVVRVIAREDGVESTRTVALPAPPAESDGENSLPTGLLATLALGVPLAALVGVGWRRRRGGDEGEGDGEES
jgi:hypothetical protein